MKPLFSLMFFISPGERFIEFIKVVFEKRSPDTNVFPEFEYISK
jgi:hypothetical protein